MTARTVFTIGLNKYYDFQVYDVNAAFLNGDLEEEIYLELPEGFDHPPGTIVQLCKAMYGLVQAARMWMKKKTKILKGFGFKRCKSDPCMFTRKLPNGEHLYVIVYVDDCVVIGPTDYATSFIQTIGKLIDIKVLGQLKRYNGGDYKFDKEMRTLTITQTDLIMKLAKDMKLIDTKTPGSSNVIQEKYSGDTAVNLKLYQQKVGVILYITKTSRPDIANQARELSQFMSHPGPSISYLYSTMEIGLTLGAINGLTRNMTVTGYCDSDFASNKDDHRSVIL